MNVSRVSNPNALRSSFKAEMESLIRDGYRFLFSSEVHGIFIVKLRHESNGRTLMLRLGRFVWCLREGKKIIKEVWLAF